MSGERSDDRDRRERRAGALPWFFGGRGQGGIVRALWTGLMTAPEAWLLRVGLGMAVALNALWLASVLWSPEAEGVPGGKHWVANLPMQGRAADTAPRPFMNSLITGFDNLLHPDFGTDGSRNAAGAAAEEDTAGEGQAEGSPQASADSSELLENLGKGMQGGEEGSDEAEAGKAGRGGAGGVGEGLGSVGLGQSALVARGGLGSTGSGTSASLAAGSHGSVGDSGREKQPFFGPGRVTARPVKGKGAMGQLKFAKDQSLQGKHASTGDQAYRAADNAFQGQTAGMPGGGSPIGGSGASQGGAGIRSPDAPVTQGGPMPANPVQRSCPAGYELRGEGCIPLEGKDVTPWKGLLQMARTFLILGAILAIIGLFLIWKGGPGLQIFGGILLGIAIGLVIAALSIGNQIGDLWGQKKQQKAVHDAGAEAMQGRPPR